VVRDGSEKGVSDEDVAVPWWAPVEEAVLQLWKIPAVDRIVTIRFLRR
jgi:hypothetical protein